MIILDYPGVPNIIITSNILKGDKKLKVKEGSVIKAQVGVM